MVDLRETLIILLLVFMGKVGETGANETVAGRGGSGGGVHDGIQDVVDPDLVAIRCEDSCCIGVCEPGFSANVVADVSDKICSAESDASGSGDDIGWVVTVTEDDAIDEAIAFGVVTSNGENNAEGGRVREGFESVVCGLDGDSIGLECRGACLSSVLPSIPK